MPPSKLLIHLEDGQYGLAVVCSLGRWKMASCLDIWQESLRVLLVDNVEGGPRSHVSLERPCRGVIDAEDSRVIVYLLTVAPPEHCPRVAHDGTCVVPPHPIVCGEHAKKDGVKVHAKGSTLDLHPISHLHPAGSPVVHHELLEVHQQGSIRPPRTWPLRRVLGRIWACCLPRLLLVLKESPSHTEADMGSIHPRPNTHSKLGRLALPTMAP
mmetsp:Transcript_22810/g.70865  ORF Transcript_22810/g.70865 Transcript_22810/m.70865 type:complete len:212 (-) Transcript_22810:674-1309(-)